MSQSSVTPPTVLDVARLAGVSISTVSRILNGNTRVAKEKREAVEMAISRLKFQPNLSARSLRSGSTKLIGVITQELESAYFTGGTLGIEKGLAGSGYTPIVVPAHWNPIEEIERARLLIARKVDALIILGGSLRDEQVIELAEQRPLAITGRRLVAPNVHSFCFDQVAGGLLAVQHLIDYGHRQIAHIAGPSGNLDADDRKEGYLQAHRNAKLNVDPRLIVSGDFMEVGGVQAMNQLLDSKLPFTAVFCANDQMLSGARLALYRRNVRVPEDISLVGFDDAPQSAYMMPPVTTIRQPVKEMGISAARAVLRALGVEVDAIEHSPLTLTIRETTRRIHA